MSQVKIDKADGLVTYIRRDKNDWLNVSMLVKPQYKANGQWVDDGAGYFLNASFNPKYHKEAFKIAEVEVGTDNKPLTRTALYLVSGMSLICSEYTGKDGQRRRDMKIKVAPWTKVYINERPPKDVDTSDPQIDRSSAPAEVPAQPPEEPPF